MVLVEKKFRTGRLVRLTFFITTVGVLTGIHPLLPLLVILNTLTITSGDYEILPGYMA